MNPMNNKMKTIGATAILSAAVASPVFAQDVVDPVPYARGPGSQPQTFYRTYGQMNPSILPPRNDREYWGLQNFGFTGRDPSRVGGDAPWLAPSGS
jgi:hypothetical protein